MLKDDRRSKKYAKSKRHYETHKNHQRSKRDVRALSGQQKKPAEDRRLNRVVGKQIADETVKICENGFYENEGGIQVDITNQLELARKGTKTYNPNELPIDISDYKPKYETGFEVVHMPTLECCYNIIYGSDDSSDSSDASDNPPQNLCALNFASAKNPGGGFLKGSDAQEECLARCSGLYTCIQDSPMYQYNNTYNNQCLYSHYIVYSPGVPVFRDDKEYELLDESYCVSFLTVPAPNAGEARARGVPNDVINSTLVERMDRLLSVAAHNGVDVLVLGAWGCGVFQNDLKLVTKHFLELIDGKYSGFFRRVVFPMVSEEDYTVVSKSIDYFMR